MTRPSKVFGLAELAGRDVDFREHLAAFPRRVEPGFDLFAHDIRPVAIIRRASLVCLEAQQLSGVFV